ncbi:aminopeptidase [Syntrophus sp. (in: bacteria)]|uniref:aminopeptidase n=1 Tax=Syntrophus sp. (in: bacteria) TaxID=48412 RepID=UPI00345EF743
MMTSEILGRYADVLIWGMTTARKKRFKKGDIVLIQYDVPALRLAEMLYGKLIERGMNVLQRMNLTSAMEHSFYSRGNSNQLVFIPPGERELYGHLNGRIYLHAPESLTHLADIDPAVIAKAQLSRKPLRDIFNEREDQGAYAWTLCTVPTEDMAKKAGLSLSDYTAQLMRACYLDERQPVETWMSVYREVGNIKAWLNRLPVRAFSVASENVDLRITPGAMRKWIGISGHNIPSFEIFLSPDWRGTEGTYYANQPSFRLGNYVEGVRLRFEKGRAVSIEAEKGLEFVVKQLSMDRGASRVGEFSLTDRRFSRIDSFMADTLFDENYGGEYGNCHIAVGASYSDTYAGNTAELDKSMKRKLGFNDSALHWDLVNTEPKTVTAELTTGKKILVYENGEFRC